MAQLERFPVRLQSAIEACENHTEDMRRYRLEMLNKYSAGFYSGEKSVVRPINMILRGVQILVPFLVSDNPMAMVTTDEKRFRPGAETRSLILNKKMKMMKLYKTLRKAVYHSLWGAGIVDTSIAYSGQTEINGQSVPMSDTYSEIVDFDDFLFDINARDIEEAEFLGNKHLIRMDILKDSGEFSNYDMVSPAVKMHGDTSPESISKENVNDGSFRELHEYAMVQKVWIPERRIIATLPVRGQGEKYLKVVEWDGPDSGPYDMLGYNYFPNTIIPIPPIYSWLAMDEQLNMMARKMFRQASREKVILAYEGQSQKDAENVVSSSDGEAINVENIDRMKEVKFGGVNPDMWPVVQWLRQQLSEQAGNMDIMGGLQPSSKTLGQDQMIQANAVKVLDDMVWQIHHFTASILEKVAHFEFTNPLFNMVVTKKVAGLEIPVEVTYQKLSGDDIRYYYDIIPYSMQKISPEVKFQKTLQWIGQVVLPTLQLGAMQGSVLNVSELAKRTAEYLHIDIEDLYITKAPMMNAQPDSYQPMAAGSPVSGQGDGDRFGGDGGSNAMSNMNQQQSRAGGMSSPSNKRSA